MTEQEWLEGADPQAMLDVMLAAVERWRCDHGDSFLHPRRSAIQVI